MTITRLESESAVTVQEGGRGGFAVVFVILAMGDRCNQPPGISWRAYDTAVLLQVVSTILAIVAERVAEEHTPISTASGAASSSSPSVPAVASTGTTVQNLVPDPPLLEPFQCNYRCLHCTNRCTRREGHKFHSCWTCRHKRH